MRVRPATPADVPAMAAILDASDDPIGWPDVSGWPYLEHLVQRASTAVAVGRDGSVVGFGGAIDAGTDGTPARWLTDLFVHAEGRGAGAGRAILDRLLDGAPDRMTASTGDPRALGLYIRAGMRPWWPLLYLSGDARRLPIEETIAVEPADVRATAAWSKAWTGRDRTADFEHYASLPEALGFAILDAGAVAAVGWARRERRASGRWLDHVSIAPDADPARAALAAWRAAAPDGGPVRGVVPGPHPAVGPMLELGIRILDRDTFCATDPGLLDPARILPNPGFL
jgi:GNAT superfamily N-acetyltransferase